MIRDWLRTLIAASLIAAVSGGSTTPALGNGNPLGDLFLGLINQAIINNAIKKWNAIDLDVRQCLTSNYGINIGVLAQNGILPNDDRLQNQMQFCTQRVAQARYDAQQQQLLAEQQHEEQQKKIALAQAAWRALDPQLRQCLTGKPGVNPDAFGNAGIAPDDEPALSQVESCRTMLAQQAQEQHDAQIRHNTLIAKFGKDQASAIESHTVLVGMSKDAVREALGQPNGVEPVPPDDELWIYGSERIAISKGKVTFIGH